MSPAKVQALLQEALTHHHAGRFTAAVPLYAQIRKWMPTSFEAYHLGGVAAFQSGKTAEAISLLRRALQLKPTSGPSAMCLGLALAQSGQPTEAGTQLRRATQLDPKNHETWSNLASLLAVQNDLTGAVAAYRESLQLNPKSAIAWSGLGSILTLLGQPAEAVEHHTRALSCDPDHPKARCSRGQAYQALHRLDEALQDFEKQIQKFPEDFEAWSYRLFLLNYRANISRETLHAAHLAFGRAAEAAVSTRIPFASAPARTTRSSRVRIAFLSPDLRTHSVAYFLEPLLNHLDPQQFEVLLYHDHFHSDETSERLRKRAALWRNFVGQSNDQVEKSIRADAPEILIDLAGHTGSNRLPLFARRLAPSQITYLGYPNTTGLSAMDFRFTDAIADPPGASEALHSERLIRFSECAWAYCPPHYVPSPQEPLARAGGPFAFGSFNNLSKINNETLRLWARILTAIPGARLVLKSLGLDADAMRPRLTAAGLPLDRVTLLPPAPSTAEHLAAYGQVDVALDPFPYNGTTTTCEALWMGVPVISLRGDRHASRVGASLLTAVGRPEWIAESEDHYCALAADLAQKPARLADLRRGLRRDLQQSVLFDHRGQADRFGRALLACREERLGASTAIRA